MSGTEPGGTKSQDSTIRSDYEFFSFLLGFVKEARLPECDWQACGGSPWWVFPELLVQARRTVFQL